MYITINNNPIVCKDNLQLSKILESNNTPICNIAVAVNDKVIPKRQWDTEIIYNNDRILIIKAVQGG